MVNTKTTAVRVIPAPGKVEGDVVEFGGLLGTGPVMPVKKYSSAEFINRGRQNSCTASKFEKLMQNKIVMIFEYSLK